MSERGRRFRERLAALPYVLGWALVRRAPESLLRRVFDVMADTAWRRRGRAALQLRANLRRVVGPGVSPARLDELTRAALRSYSRYWMEMFRLPSYGPETLVSRFHVYDGQRLWAALNSGRGVVLALPHSGNWDHAGAWIAVSGYPLTTVAERLRPESLYERFVAFRERLGMEVLPLTGGSASVYRTLADRLRAGRLVCLLADRDLTRSGVEVTFFGEPARMPSSPAALALETGAALVPVTLWYEGERWAGRVHPEVAPPSGGSRTERLAAMTQELASAFEESIAAHPADWHMVQRLWKTDSPRGAAVAGRSRHR